MSYVNKLLIIVVPLSYWYNSMQSRPTSPYVSASLVYGTYVICGFDIESARVKITCTFGEEHHTRF